MRRDGWQATRRVSALVGGLVLVAFGLAAVPADAAPASVTCGQTIRQSTVLGNDVGPCAGDGIVIGRAGITVDLAGHTISGTRAMGNSSAGIRVDGFSQVTVTGGASGGRQGAVTGFDAGVFILNGGSNTVTNLNVHDNIGYLYDPNGFRLGDGILIDNSRSTTVVGNTVTHNGPWDGIGIVDPRADNNTIQGNLVADNDLVQYLIIPGEAPIPEVKDRGIRVIAFDRTSPISGTMILDNVIRGNGADGIEMFLGVDGAVVRGNTVNANGFVNAQLNGGSGGYEIGDAGIVVGGASDHAVIERNEVHGNAGGGIMVIGCCGSPDDFVSGHAQVLYNDASNNVVSRYNAVAAADLFDGFPGCQTNTWFANTWGRGGYDPPCTTVGGSGPR